MSTKKGTAKKGTVGKELLEKIVETAGAVTAEDGSQVYTLRKPKKIDGKLVTTLTMREMTGADYVAVDEEVEAMVAASGGKFTPGDTRRTYLLAARGVGLNYNDFVTLCPADCTYLTALVNKAGGF